MGATDTPVLDFCWSPKFQSQVDFLVCVFRRLHVMDSWDLPLVRYLLTFWRPARQLNRFDLRTCVQALMTRIQDRACPASHTACYETMSYFMSYLKLVPKFWNKMTWNVPPKTLFCDLMELDHLSYFTHQSNILHIWHPNQHFQKWWY